MVVDPKLSLLKDGMCFEVGLIFDIWFLVWFIFGVGLVDAKILFYFIYCDLYYILCNNIILCICSYCYTEELNFLKICSRLFWLFIKLIKDVQIMLLVLAYYFYFELCIDPIKIATLIDNSFRNTNILFGVEIRTCCRVAVFRTHAWIPWIVREGRLTSNASQGFRLWAHILSIYWSLQIFI